MQLTGTIYRSGVVLFGLFFALVVWGFWASYYSNPLALASRAPNTALVQIHGIVMTAWCVMLIAQAYLIRSNRRLVHRAVGTASYVLAPLVVLSQAVVIRNFAIAGAEVGEGGLILVDDQYVFVSYTLVSTLIFAGLYVLAVRFRKDPRIHARLMVCTPIPFLGAATDRIITRYVPALANYLPDRLTHTGTFVASAGFFLGDLILLSLAVWDWSSHRRIHVFAPVLLVMVVYQVFTFSAYKVPVWRTFCEWFVGA